MSESIASTAIDYLTELDAITQSKSLDAFNGEVSPVLWADELGRFRVWVANMGAQETGEYSLDERLRDIPHIKEQIKRSLNRLRRAIRDLQEALRIISHDEITSDDICSDEDEDQGKTECQLIYKDICDTISELFKAAILMQRAEQHEHSVRKRTPSPHPSPTTQGIAVGTSTHQSDTKNKAPQYPEAFTEAPSSTRSPPASVAQRAISAPSLYQPDTKNENLRLSYQDELSRESMLFTSEASHGVSVPIS